MTTTKYTFETLAVTFKDDIAHLQLNRGKSNPINRQMIRELHQFFETAQEDEDVEGVILQGKEGFFSSGLDLKELYALNEVDVKEFWVAFMKMTNVLVAFPKPFITAITGHSPAGGCVLSICADYRIMAEGKFIIGLNEIPVGIVVPKSIFDLYAFWVGNRVAYQFLLEGKLVTPDVAHNVGLVDEVVPADKVVERAMEKMEDYTNFDLTTWSISKQNLRSALLKDMQNQEIEDILEPMLKQWWSPRTRALLGGIVASLSK